MLNLSSSLAFSDLTLLDCLVEFDGISGLFKLLPVFELFQLLFLHLDL